MPLRVAADSSVDALKRAIVDIDSAHYGDAIKAIGGASSSSPMKTWLTSG